MSLSISEIRDILGEITYSLVRLCTSSKINMWSKIKPMDDNYPYGLKLTPYSTAANALTAAINGGSSWAYVTPPSKYNIGSFSDSNNELGYNHSAQAPFGYRPSQTQLYTGDSINIREGGSITSDYQITDFLTSSYEVECVFRPQGASWTGVSSEGIITATDLTVAGTYDCAAVLTNGSTYYLCPNPYFTITRASGSPVALVSCSLNAIGTAASNIVMRGIGSSRTITSIQAVWRKSMNTAWNAAGAGEADGGTIISSQTLSTEGTVLTLDSGIQAILGVTDSNLADGYLLLRFIYVGPDRTYQQQTVLSAGGSTPIDPPTA